ncbi:hypothetical protein T10_4011 [Trichinella papuae]|uniref:Secreted protein n=1 Tax=Trichinella papuae TaxID=268474 RepID=A0A0V1M1F2_9BILA|nr:hypothetical protein T10_4011 [Trichinella papuae]
MNFVTSASSVLLCIPALNCSQNDGNSRTLPVNFGMLQVGSLAGEKFELGFFVSTCSAFISKYLSPRPRAERTSFSKSIHLWISFSCSSSSVMTASIASYIESKVILTSIRDPGSHIDASRSWKRRVIRRFKPLRRRFSLSKSIGCYRTIRLGGPEMLPTFSISVS